MLGATLLGWLNLSKCLLSLLLFHKTWIDLTLCSSLVESWNESQNVLFSTQSVFSLFSSIGIGGLHLSSGTTACFLWQNCISRMATPNCIGFLHWFKALGVFVSYIFYIWLTDCRVICFPFLLLHAMYFMLCAYHSTDVFISEYNNPFKLRLLFFPYALHNPLHFFYWA